MKTILITAFAFFVGCVTHNDSQFKKVEHFPLEKRVKLDSFKVKSDLFFVSDMAIWDDKLVTLDTKNDVFFQFFDLPKLEYIGSQIHKGDGPTEEVLIFPFIENVGDKAFAYRTIDKIKIVSYDLVNRKLFLLKSYAVPQELEILNYCLLNNSLCGYDMFKKAEKEFVKYDFSTNKTKNFGPPLPSVNFAVSDDRKNMLFTKVMVSKADGTRFAALYDKFPLLRIYDNNGELVSETEYLNRQQAPIGYTNKNMSISDIKSTTINYMRVKATQKYIYGLYSGKTHKDLADLGIDGTSCCYEIHIWDWNGNPVARLMLDKNVTCFAVSQDDSCIVLYSSLNENTLYKMNIPLF